MVRIRLMRVGKTKQPSYRVIVADQRSPRDGRIIEAIGHYQPRREPSHVEINTERAVYWLSQGAQPSSQCRKLLEITGAWATFKGEPLPPSATAATPATEDAPAAARKKATPAKSVKATPAASVEETADEAGTTENEDEASS